MASLPLPPEDSDLAGDDDVDEGYMLSSSLRRPSDDSTPMSNERWTGAGAPSTHPYVIGSPGRTRIQAGADWETRLPMQRGTQSPMVLSPAAPTPPITPMRTLPNKEASVQMPKAQGDASFAIDGHGVVDDAEVPMMCSTILQMLKQVDARFQETTKMIVNSSHIMEKTLGSQNKTFEKALARYHDSIRDQLIAALNEVSRQQTEDIRGYFQAELQLASYQDGFGAQPSEPTLGALLAMEGDGYEGQDLLTELPTLGPSRPMTSPLALPTGDSGRNLMSPLGSKLSSQPSTRNPSTQASSIRIPSVSKADSTATRSRPDWQTTGTERLNKASSSMQESILNHGQNGHGGDEGYGDFATIIKSHDVMKLVEMIGQPRHIPEGGWSLATILNLGEEPPRLGFLPNFITSIVFERIIGMVIILHAFFVGFALESAVDNPIDGLSPAMRGLELVFLLIYGSELILKLSVHRLYFFINDDAVWNSLDFLLLLLSCVDMVLQDYGLNGNGFSFVFVRLLRLLRLSKAFRVFRVMVFFKELRVLLRCIQASLRSLLWAIIFLVVFYYIFAVVFVSGVVSYIKTEPEPSEAAEVLEWHGDICTCMHSLFLATTGGQDWMAIGEPLKKVGNFYYGTFLFYIALELFAVLNILTGIFVDSAIRASQSDMEGNILARLEADRLVEDMLSGLFNAMDVDADGLLTLEEFCGSMRDAPHWAYFRSLGIEFDNSEEFYLLMCQYLNTDQPDQRGFIRACRRFRGHSKFSDMCTLRLLQGDMRLRMVHVQRNMERLRAKEDETTPRASV